MISLNFYTVHKIDYITLMHSFDTNCQGNGQGKCQGQG